MTRSMIKAIVILPGTALVYVPALILWLSVGGPWAAQLAEGWVWLAVLALAASGLGLIGWTMRLFAKKGGGGSPAPWDPIPNFVISGPYLHVRNPMIAGVILTQLSMAAALTSWPLFGWAVFFFLLNTVYFIFSEEPGLERRFGEPYRRYRAAVPRWISRREPYRAKDAGIPR